MPVNDVAETTYKISRTLIWRVYRGTSESGKHKDITRTTGGLYIRGSWGHCVTWACVLYTFLFLFTFSGGDEGIIMDLMRISDGIQRHECYFFVPFYSSWELFIFNLKIKKLSCAFLTKHWFLKENYACS